VDEPDEPVALFGHHLIPDDDDDFDADQPTNLSNNLFDNDDDILQVSAPTNNEENEGGNEGENEGGPPTSATTSQPHVVNFLHGENCMLIVEEAEDEERKLNDPAHELLLYHYRLGHESFTNLQAMAKAGILPTRLATCRIPQCAACHYGKASKVPWRVKGDPKDGKLFEATVAGQVVSVDQLQGLAHRPAVQLRDRLRRPLQSTQLRLRTEDG
jgi:hypothetical protein